MGMKKFAMFVFSAALHAAPVGNTAVPDLIAQGLFTSCKQALNFRCGYEGDFIADGRMEQTGRRHGRVDSYRQDANSGTIVFNMQDRMDLYGVFGTSKTRADWRFINQAGSVVRIEAETTNNFLWAASARVILVEWGNTSLGCGGRYSRCQYLLSSITFNGITASTGGAQLYWREWQIDSGVSYKMHFFTPYIGVKYSSALSCLDNFSVPISASGTGSNTFKNRNSIGLYMGCGLSTGKWIMLNIEGRLIDEEAVTFSGDMKF